MIIHFSHVCSDLKTKLTFQIIFLAFADGVHVRYEFCLFLDNHIELEKGVYKNIARAIRETLLQAICSYL